MTLAGMGDWDLGHLGDNSLSFILGQGQLVNDRLGTGNDTLFDIPCPEIWQDLSLNNVGGQGVGQDRLQTIAHLDPHLAVIGGDQQDHAVIAGLVANPPCPTQLIAIILNGIALQIGNGGDDHLMAGLGLKVCQLAREVLLRLGGQEVCSVHHPPGQGREGRGGQGHPVEHQGDDGEDRDGD